MSDITLSAAVRSSLLSLSKTTTLIERTQNRLSSGLRVASAIDDPVSFFQAKGLNDRVQTLNEKKDDVDQAVSRVTAALDGINGVDTIIRQMKGVANSMKSATNAQIASLISQFNDLRGQVDQLANDTSFQGVSLINSTATTLTVEFSDRTASTLTVQGVSVKSSALAISAVSTAANIVAIGTGGNTLNTAGSVLSFTFSSASSVTLFHAATETSALSLTIAGNTDLTVASGGTKNVTYGGETLSVFIASGGATFSASKLTKLQVVSATTASAVVAGGAYIVLTAALVVGDVAAQTESLSLFNNTTGINDIVDSIDTAITTLTTNAQTLGTNVSLLQARLDFTENYVNTLEEASGKLTLADINEEGANLLSLQTRQQLGITALAFAGQSEQGILTLFQ
mgnify:CR=1 FL=1